MGRNPTNSDPLGAFQNVDRHRYCVPVLHSYLGFARVIFLGFSAHRGAGTEEEQYHKNKHEHAHDFSPSIYEMSSELMEFS